MPDKLTDLEIIKALECCTLSKQICPKNCPLANDRGCMVKVKENALDLINRLQAESETLRAYIHDNGLEWDLLSYSKKKKTRKNEKCEYCIDEVCVNADCPLRADFCPVINTPEVCRYEKRGEQNDN